MQKGLGKGLDAIFGADAAEAASGRVDTLPLARIEPRLDQPRSRFEPEALAELADSIREHGLLQPIAVRKLDGGYYQIVAGERRWRAARQAGLTEVPVIVLEADDRRAMELAMVENLQREDLNPVEEARGYRSLLDSYGLTQEQAAAAVGKSRPVVANALRLLELPEEVLLLLETGALSPSQARTILELERTDDRREAARRAVEENLTVRELTALVRRMKADKPTPKKEKKPASIYVEEAEKQLAKRLGRRVRIVEGRRRGKLELEYYGPEDFEALYRALSGIGGAGK